MNVIESNSGQSLLSADMWFRHFFQTSQLNFHYPLTISRGEGRGKEYKKKKKKRRINAEYAVKLLFLLAVQSSSGISVDTVNIIDLCIFLELEQKMFSYGKRETWTVYTAYFVSCNMYWVYNFSLWARVHPRHPWFSRGKEIKSELLSLFQFQWWLVRNDLKFLLTLSHMQSDSKWIIKNHLPVYLIS